MLSFGIFWAATDLNFNWGLGVLSTSSSTTLLLTLFTYHQSSGFIIPHLVSAVFEPGLFAKTAKNAGDYYFVSLHTAANNSDPLFSAIWPYFTWLYALGHYNMFKTISKKEYKLQVYFGIGTSTTTTSRLVYYLEYLGWGTIQNVNNP